MCGEEIKPGARFKPCPADSREGQARKSSDKSLLGAGHRSYAEQHRTGASLSCCSKERCGENKMVAASTQPKIGNALDVAALGLHGDISGMALRWYLGENSSAVLVRCNSPVVRIPGFWP